jgi:flavorubredoxin
VKAVQIEDGVYWVGAIDWALRDFHGYSTHRGTTYNSYLVIDDQVTLIDTVKAPFFGEMLERIGSVVNPKEIQNIITNHVELDHSGSLGKTVHLVPDARIYASKRAVEAIASYHGLEDLNVVKTGDTLSIGKRTLSFIESPMLHWPDNMMTYCGEDKILFSNDAFGQHLASAARFNDEVDRHILFQEAAKYYANILMPFSSLVEKKIGEIGELGLDIGIICPSHGVIWRDNPAQILRQYMDWAGGKSAGGFLVVYDTMWQSTEMLAEEIAETIAGRGGKVQLFKLQADDKSDIITEVLGAETIVIGSPTLNNKMLPSVAGFLNYLTGLRPPGKRFAVFGSYGWGGGGTREIIEELEKARLEVIKPPLDIKFRPGKDIQEKVEDFVGNLMKGGGAG